MEDETVGHKNRIKDLTLVELKKVMNRIIMEKVSRPD